MYILSIFAVDELTFITIWIAMFAGLVSFISPCVFPLLPAYLAQLTGGEVQQNQLSADRRLIFSRSIGFIIGFTSIFVALGASSSLVGGLFLEHSSLIERLGGIIIVLFGLQLIGVFQLNLLMSEKRIGRPKPVNSFGRSIAFGLIFAAGWTPCIGLVLGSILALAGQDGSAFGGMILLFFYSAGLAIPFLLVSMIFAKSLDRMRSLNKYLPLIQKFGGGVMIAIGIMLFTGWFSRLAGYLAQYYII
ncbi:cytochrome c biogenesis CcdA family protein [Alkalicoccus chagannorensis]|uniref:cytochrome c biogenesis CcdA family protein n=1 Tax=Alkalicoccus chagannorensis TaxID=427072 RepID=UPI0003FEDD1F|nr:cytochrome c biogenesis protein CcdA [Alkalicoccus chagannorensis]